MLNEIKKENKKKLTRNSDFMAETHHGVKYYSVGQDVTNLSSIFIEGDNPMETLNQVKDQNLNITNSVS